MQHLYVGIWNRIKESTLCSREYYIELREITGNRCRPFQFNCNTCREL
uniref:Uncharacterized protein n=1 Tax=Arundo donax TaxID=35708 RepID=A0A0A9B6C3_ARUDO